MMIGPTKVSNCIRAAAVAICVVTAAQELRAADAENVDKEEIQKVYMTFLAEEGYVPKVVNEGRHIQFKKEGGSFYIRINEKDPQFFQLIYPGFWDIESESERNSALQACNSANWDTKTTKLCVNKDSVWASVELFVESPEDFKPVFARSLRALDYGVERFVGKMRE